MNAQLQISLPERLKQWLDRQATSRGFQTSGELVEDLIRREQEREAHSRLEAKLEQIIDSEEPRPMTPEDWANIRGEGQRRLNELKKK